MQPRVSRVHISLIGMSNIGKSHWARHLAAEAGYERVDCDSLIEKKLAAELDRLGYAGLHDVAKWMGQPYDARYTDASRKYLACEREVMKDIIERLRRSPARPLVIDTTGSVVYIDDDTTEQLRALTCVVYLEASQNHVSKLFEHYIANPKPVIWGNSFAPRQGEAPRAALQRCYTDLLACRAERYQGMAHLRIPFELHRASGTTWARLMAEGHPSAA